MKTFFMFFAVILLGIFSAYFFFKAADMQVQYGESEGIVATVKEELIRYKEEEKRLRAQIAKLEENALSFSKLTAQHQNENDALGAKVQELHEASAFKDEQIESLMQELETAKQNLSPEDTFDEGSQDSIRKENEQLKEEIAFLKDAVRKEKALYHYNLGVAYTKANLFNDAIGAYKKSIEFDSSNAEAHYNLGLLYDKYQHDTELAALHYRTYLELKPQASDREEIEQLLDTLIARIFQ